MVWNLLMQSLFEILLPAKNEVALEENEDE